MATETLEIGDFGRGEAEDRLEEFSDAVDNAVARDKRTWLTEDGKRVAMIATVEDGERLEAADALLLETTRVPLKVIRDQARAYMEARFGEEVWFRAPETFEGAFDRWIWAVASSYENGTGAEAMAAITEHFRAQR